MANSTHSPYVGLRPFSAADIAFFFGRENERRIVAANITASRLTVLYGPSGVGKSSVLDGGILYDFAHLAKQRPGPPRFAAAYFRDWSKWREDPMSGVAQAIHEYLLKDYAIELSGDAHDFRDTVDNWMQTQSGGLLIVLDQFEEYLLYHREEGSRDSFALQFPEALENADVRVNFLIALRDDALASLDRFRGQIPNLFDNRLQLKLLSRAAGREAILRPLDQLRVQGVSQVVIEEALVEAVLDQVAAGRVKLGPGGEGELAEAVGDASGDRPIEAPYLQLVMERIWNEEQKQESWALRLSTFQRLGEAQRIVQDHLDSRMSTLSESDQAVAASVFRYLVTPSGAKIALSPYDLAHSAALPEGEVKPVLDGLAQGDARILRAIAAASDMPDENRYEIFHDALARAILDWTERRKRRVDEAKLLDAEIKVRGEQKKKIIAAVAAGALGLLVVLLIGSLVSLFWRAERESVARALAAQATRSLSDDPERGLLLALYAASSTYGKNQVLLPEVEETLHRTLDVARARSIIDGHAAMLMDIAVSPDGSTLATGDWVGTIKLWDAASGQQRGTLTGHGGPIRRLAFSPDGNSLASASEDSTARIWRIKPRDSEHSVIILRGHRGAVNAVAYDSTGQWIVTGSSDSTARLWNAFSGDSVRTFPEHTGGVSAVGFAHSGAWVVTSDESSARVWELDGRPHCTFPEHSEGINALVVLPPGGTSIATANQNGSAAIWNADKCVVLRTFPPHTNSLFDVAISPDGSMLATASSDGTVKVWSVKNQSELFSLVGHSGAVQGVKFSPDGHRIYTASRDSTARTWESSRVMSEVDVLQTDNEAALIRAVTFNPHRLQLAAVDQNGHKIVVSDLIHPRRSYQRSFDAPAYSVSFSPDGKRIAVGGEGGVKLFDADAANLVGQLGISQLLSDTIYPFATSVNFSPDGARIAVGNTTGVVALWNLADSSVSALRGHSARVNSVAFDSTGHHLLTTSDDGTVFLWTLNGAATRLDTLETHDGRVTSAVFSPHGDLWVTGGEDHLIRVTSVEKGGVTRRLRGPNNTIWSVAFSPHGDRIATASFDGTARLWSVASGQEIMRLRADPGRMYGVAFSSDGRYVATSNNLGEVHVSIVDPLALLLRGWDYVNRSLTDEECSRILGLTAAKCPRAPRIVAEGHKLARAGEINRAKAKFVEAQRLDPVFRHVNADSLAGALAVDAWVGRGLEFLRGNRTIEAMEQFERARSVDTATARDIVGDVVGGIAVVLGSGDTAVVGAGLAAYREALTWDPNFRPTAEVLNNVCWWGSIGGHPRDAADVCEEAVKASPNFGSIRDSRGVNRALRGDTKGALDDFRFFVAQATNSEPGETQLDTDRRRADRQRRLRWIRALEAGGPTPFTKKELAELRRE